MVRRDARILVSHDSKVLEASDAALELLELSLDQLRALPPGAMSLEEDRAASDAFQTAWREAGGGAIVGAGTIRLLDGRLLRLRYMIEPRPDATYELILERSPEPVTDEPRTYTLGAVLASWRAAERRLAAVPPDSLEWSAVQAEIEYFRSEYQRLSRPRRAETTPSKDG